MPSGAKGKRAYQGSLAVQQALATESSSGDVDHATGEIGDVMPLATQAGTSRNLPLAVEDDDDDDIDLYGPAAPATLPPPTPSPSKRRFSALEDSVGPSTSSQSIIPSSKSTPSGISPTSRSASGTSSAKRGKLTGAIAVSSLNNEISSLKDFLRMDSEQARSSIDERRRRETELFEQDRLDRLERERLKTERMEKFLERGRLNLEHMERGHPPLSMMAQQEPKNSMLDAINRMQEVDSDLSAEDQVTLMDIFADPGSAMTYLALKSDEVRKVWIKCKLSLPSAS